MCAFFVVNRLIILVALNFILQLLFLPFGQSRIQTVVGSYLMVPGTVAL